MVYSYQFSGLPTGTRKSDARSRTEECMLDAQGPPGDRKKLVSKDSADPTAKWVAEGLQHIRKARTVLSFTGTLIITGYGAIVMTHTDAQAISVAALGAIGSTIGLIVKLRGAK